MNNWDEYPQNYRASEVGHIIHTVEIGGCVSIVGLSGSGKSNLLGFIAHRIKLPSAGPSFVLVDCNRLGESSVRGFFKLVFERLPLPQATSGERTGQFSDGVGSLPVLEERISYKLTGGGGLCLLLDRFDAVTGSPDYSVIANNLRALRDEFKYRLSYVTATRDLLDARSELAELFFGHSLWLGPLAKTDALWSAHRDAERLVSEGEHVWDGLILEKLVELSWGYPSLLRAACEAYADGVELESRALEKHPAVLRRVEEFWADNPGEDALEQSRLAGHPWLNFRASTARARWQFDTTQLTAKEHLLLEYLLEHPNQVCEKDDLVQAVWPEDVIFEQGVRDESLAQLVRRLRVKVEPNPAEPRYIHTLPGRGYLFKRAGGSL